MEHPGTDRQNKARSEYIAKAKQSTQNTGHTNLGPAFTVRLPLEELKVVAQYMEETMDYRIKSKSDLIRSAIVTLAEMISEQKHIMKPTSTKQALKYLNGKLRLNIDSNEQAKEQIKRRERTEELEVARGDISKQVKDVAQVINIQEEQMANDWDGTAEEFEEKIMTFVEKSRIEWHHYHMLYPQREFDKMDEEYGS